MQGYAVAALGGPRWQALITTMRFVGVDLTGASFRLQVRDKPNSPGAPLIDLQTVSTAAAEGVRLISVDMVDGKPVSTIGIRINETTMEAMPFTGALGDGSGFAWDMQVTPTGGYKAKWIGGDFVVEGAVTGADAAPATFASYTSGSTPRLPESDDSSFQVGQTVISVQMLGPGLIIQSEGEPAPGSIGADQIVNGVSEVAAVRAKLGAADAALVEPAARNLPFASSAPSNLSMSPRPNIRFNAAMNAARAAGVLRVTVLGDSIMTDTGSGYSNTLAENMQRLLQMELPGVEVILNNLAIGGRNIAQLADQSYTATASNVSPGNFYIAPPTSINSNYWAGGSVTGKSWGDHARDTTPHMIVLAMGENSGIDTVAFKAALDTFINYTQTWAVKPWFVLVSALVPEGAEANRQDKQAFADLLQFTAIEQGFGHIDANAYYRLMRDGKRRNLIRFVEERDFTGWGSQANWATQNTASLSGTTLTTGPAGRAERQINARDFDVSDRFTIASSDAVWSLEGRRRPGTSDVWLVQAAFADQGDGNGGAVRIYFRDGTVRAATRFPARGVGQRPLMRVKFVGPLILVFLDSVLILTHRSTLGMYAGAVAIGTAAGSGSHSEFLIAFAEEYQAANAGYFNAQYLLNDNLHHPTGAGTFQTYIPAMRQFVSEMIAAWRRPLILTKGRQTSGKSFPTGALEFQDETSVAFRSIQEQVVKVTIQLGYKNPNASTALLTLQVNGTGVAPFYLDRTASTGADNAQLFATTFVTVPAGDVLLRLAFAPPAGGTQPVTSTGTANDRMMVAEVSVL